MAYKVHYANLPLHNYVTILNVKRTLLSPRSNFTKEIPSMNGQYYMGYKYAPKNISLECLLRANTKEELMDNIQDLNFILDVKLPSRLIIEDTPDRYNYAVIDGAIDVEKILQNGKFILNFICYDPVTYSVDSDYSYDDGSHKLTIDNCGTISTYPKVSVAFQNEAFFLQCTNNNTGETVLVGTPSSIDKPKYEFNPVVLRDECTTLTNWNSVGNVVDNAEVNGSLSVNAGGYGIYCNNFGSGNGWHGGARRKNLGQEVKDFRVRVKIEHNSLGDLNGKGATSTPPSNGEKYTVNASPSLRIRSNRGTQFDQIGSIPNGAVVTIGDISGGWGKVNYNGVIGFISMDYVKKGEPAPPPTSTTPPPSPPSLNGSYRINASPSLRIRSGRGTNYKQIGSIPNGRTVSVTDVSQNWGKVTYSGKTGYISMQYAIKTGSSRGVDLKSDYDSAEEALGRVELYGFDKNGVKLFKVAMKDTEKFYEYSEPNIEIGSTLVLDDGKKCPSPKTISVTEGDKNIYKDVDSGVFGDWNDFEGWFTVERKTVGNVQQWTCRVEKINTSGVVTRSMTTGTISNSKYPTGSLTNLVMFIGGHGQEVPVEVMNINHIEVDNLGTPPKPEENKPIFRKGDELVIDFDTQSVSKNGLPFMQELDIGSQFFECPVGKTKVTFRSEDKQMNAIASVQKRWI